MKAGRQEEAVDHPGSDGSDGNGGDGDEAERGPAKASSHPLRPGEGVTGRRERTPLYVGMTAVLAAGVALGGVALGRAGGGTGPERHHAELVSASSRAVTPGATITVTGSGTVQGTPDTVNFGIGVQSTAPTATAALADNNARMAALEAALEAHDVTKVEMQTSDLSIWPNYNNSNVLTGFSVSDDLNVTMHAVAHAGAAIQAGADAVGNGVQLNGISFSISNQSALLAAARAKAMRSAATEASQVAAGAGLALGGVEKVTDQENSASPVVYPEHMALAASSAAAVPISTGTQPVSVNVTVVYLLRSAT